ncbi:unnamed protein product, partial [Musa textilis]
GVERLLGQRHRRGRREAGRRRRRGEAEAQVSEAGRQRALRPLQRRRGLHHRRRAYDRSAPMTAPSISSISRAISISPCGCVQEGPRQP